jgi:hypothetical protein
VHVSKGLEVPANVFAEQAFLTSGQLCRVDGFPGTICYYYEIKGRLTYVHIYLVVGQKMSKSFCH